jgi:hypothetical protein
MVLMARTTACSPRTARQLPASLQHDNRFIHQISVDGLGLLEAFP